MKIAPRVSPAAVTGGRRATLLPLGVGSAALVCVGYVASVDPNAAGHYPTCPFLAITGWYCPGCGALRAVHALAHGDLVTALARNPFTVVVVGYLAVTWLLWFRRSASGRPLRWLAPPWVLYGVLSAILAFWVLRNVPGWTWLSPA
ncbi:MAG: DUF2752 domain-containing protein [Dermatophilaceae bacterium]|nr:DUF2752 domain-containing protein [Dermatophilaceae bacterium]